MPIKQYVNDPRVTL